MPYDQALANFAPVITDDNVFLDLLGVGEEANCRYLWARKNSKKQEHNWFSIGQRKKQKGQLTTVTDVYECMSQCTNDSPYPVDFFLSPNEFFDWRCGKSLARLHANYIEIDTVGHEVLSDMDEQAIISDVLQQISLKSIPLPNAIVSSGSGGWHLYWIYEPVESYRWRQEIWNAFTNKLSTAIGKGSNWEVDYGASVDLTRVLRLPGSIHSRSGRTVKAYSLSKSRYDFDELMRTMDICPDRPSHLQVIDGGNNKPVTESVTKRKLSKEQLTVYQANGRHNIKRYWANIHHHILAHCRSIEIREGLRDSAAFFLFVSKINACDDVEEAWSLIKELNSEFIKLDDRELVSYLSTAKTTRYHYTKNKLAIMLQKKLLMNVDFLFISKPKVRLSPSEIKRRQQDSAASTAAKKRVKTLDALQEAITFLTASGVVASQKLVAEVTKMSERTVRRHWQQLNKNPQVIRSVSI